MSGPGYRKKGGWVQSVKGGTAAIGTMCSGSTNPPPKLQTITAHISDLIRLNSQAPRNTHNLCSTCIIFKAFSSFFQCLFLIQVLFS